MANTANLPCPAVNSSSARAESIIPAAPGKISDRLDRIKFWHAGARHSADRLKLFAFLAGMELTLLKDEFGISPGRPRNGASVAPLFSEGGWKDYVEQQAGFGYRTSLNYERWYLHCSDNEPTRALAGRIRQSLQGGAGLALQLKFDEALQSISAEDIAAFQEATDPWSLSGLYERPLRAVNGHKVEEGKKKAGDAQLTFWFGELETKVRRREHLKLPAPQRQLLLDQLESMVRELRDSLK